MYKKELPLALIPFLLTQLIYILTLAPTVTSEDSGELITAASQLGVPHPPGFPLYCLIGFVFSQLPLPIAWCINYMSAFFASATCMVVYYSVRRLGCNSLVAVISSCLLGFSWHFWNQAVIAEVYSLNAFFFSLFLLLSISLYHEFKWFKVNAFCLLFGLALTNHYMLTLLVLPPFFILFLCLAKKHWSWYQFGISILLVILPLGLYSYLYFAAKANPVLNWGDPSTFSKLIFHVKREAYRSLELSKDIPFTIKLFYFFQYLYLLISQFSALVFVPCLLFSLSIWHKNKTIVSVLLGVIIFNSFILLSILKFSAEMENFTRVEEYYLPSYIAGLCLISFGLQRIYLFLRQKRLGFILGLLPLFLLFTHWKTNNFSSYYLAYDYNKTILEDLPPNAIYFPSGDYNAFPVIYLQAIEGVRPDILIADITGELEKKVLDYVSEIDPDGELRNKILKTLTDQYPKAHANSIPVIQKVLIEYGQRPVFFTGKSDIKPYSDYSVYNHGLVYVALKKGQDNRYHSKMKFGDKILRNIIEPTAEDDLGRSILSNTYQMWGEHLLINNEVSLGLEKFDEAIKYSFYSKEGLNNLASSLSGFKQNKKAIELYERAISLHPEYRTGRANLYRAYLAMGDQMNTKRVLHQLMALDGRVVSETNEHQIALKTNLDRLYHEPNNPILHHDCGVAYANLGDLTNAQLHFEKAVALDPDYQLAIKNLVKLYQQTSQEPEKVKALLERIQE